MKSALSATTPPPLGAARNGRKEQACASVLLRMADTPVAAAVAPTRVACRVALQSIEPGDATAHPYACLPDWDPDGEEDRNQISTRLIIMTMVSAGTLELAEERSQADTGRAPDIDQRGADSFAPAACPNRLWSHPSPGRDAPLRHRRISGSQVLGQTRPS